MRKQSAPQSTGNEIFIIIFGRKTFPIIFLGSFISYITVSSKFVFFALFRAPAITISTNFSRINQYVFGFGVIQFSL